MAKIDTSTREMNDNQHRLLDRLAEEYGDNAVVTGWNHDKMGRGPIIELRRPNDGALTAIIVANMTGRTRRLMAGAI